MCSLACSQTACTAAHMLPTTNKPCPAQELRCLTAAGSVSAFLLLLAGLTLHIPPPLPVCRGQSETLCSYWLSAVSCWLPSMRR